MLGVSVLLGVVVVVTLAVGVSLVCLGAFVLLRRPDSDGGKLSLPGVKIESPKAALPLAGLGVVLVLWALTTISDQDESSAEGAGSPAPTSPPSSAARESSSTSREPVTSTTTATTVVTDAQISLSPDEGVMDQPLTVTVHGEGFAAQERVRLQFTEDERECFNLLCEELSDAQAGADGSFRERVNVTPGYLVSTRSAFFNAIGQSSQRVATAPFRINETA